MADLARADFTPLRILVPYHAPWDRDAPSRHARQLVTQLRALGDRVRVLRLDTADLLDPADAPDPAEEDETRLVCGDARAGADVPLPLPCFRASPPPAGRSGQTLRFEQLTDRQLADYRERLREALNHEVTAFNPHLVHAHHAWIFGHLALEAGVPYVLSVWRDELETLARDGRFQRIVHETAENAARLFVAEDGVRQAWLAGDAEIDAARLDEFSAATNFPRERSWHDVYQRLLAERFRSGP